MKNIVLTYNFVDTEIRAEFVGRFEEILVNMGLTKEPSNQSTYFGPYRSAPDFVRDLFNAINRLEWRNEDIVTVYYPKVIHEHERNHADLGKHCFKNEGSAILNHIIFQD